MKKSIVLVIIVIVIAIIVYVFSKNNSAAPMENMQSATPTAETQMQPSGQKVETHAQSSTKVSIVISNYTFSPSSITVKKGTIITWKNMDGAPHTITGDINGPASGSLGTGATYSYIFNTPGIFPYHCSIHPGMHGSITVIE